LKNSNDNNENLISPNVIRRMPRYLRKLDELSAAGVNRISSGELSRQLGLTASQIRQDFSCFGEFGQQGYGYKVSALRNEIASILGTPRSHSAVLIGVGNLGYALMCNFSFEQCGIKLEAAFDVKEDLIGREVNGVVVHHMDELPEFLRENNISVAVLCIPKSVAVSVAQLLRDADIRAIWNFTNVELASAEDLSVIDICNYNDEKYDGTRSTATLVENVHFSDSLLSLSYYMADQLERRAELDAKNNT